MGNGQCIHYVEYAPPTCTHFEQGSFVHSDCSEPCDDIIVEGGDCDGAYLMVYSDTC